MSETLYILALDILQISRTQSNVKYIDVLVTFILSVQMKQVLLSKPDQGRNFKRNLHCNSAVEGGMGFAEARRVWTMFHPERI